MTGDAVPGPDEDVDVTALAVNVTVPEDRRWTDDRRGETFPGIGACPDRGGRTSSRNS
jgi:hypothetical protein